MYQTELASQAATAATRTAIKLIPANDMAFLQPVMAASLAGNEPLREAGWEQILRTRNCRSESSRAMSIQDQVSEENGRRAAQRERPSLPASTLRLVKRLRLTYIDTAALTIKRQRHGRGFRYLARSGKTVGTAEAKRLAALAVPPAYDDVLYAADPMAHIQAIGRDAAGRLQYRYHPEWQRVRETRKARRLARLAEALPTIRRSKIGRAHV